jgi:hypothetical protein
MRSTFQLKHGSNRYANTGVKQRVRAAAAWVHLCRPYSSRRRRIMVTGLEQRPLSSETTHCATAARFEIGFFGSRGNRGGTIMCGLKPISKNIAILVITVASCTSPASADMKEVVSLLLRVCLAGGTSAQVEGEAKGDVALTLKALRTGDIGATGALAGKYSKSDWEGLQGGINAGITQLQADQADKARACLSPYMPGIVQAILQSK